MCFPYGSPNWTRSHMKAGLLSNAPLFHTPFKHNPLGKVHWAFSLPQKLLITLILRSPRALFRAWLLPLWLLSATLNVTFTLSQWCWEVPFYSWGRCALWRLRNLLKFSQSVRSRAGILTWSDSEVQFLSTGYLGLSSEGIVAPLKHIENIQSPCYLYAGQIGWIQQLGSL